jgi:3-carboxy-cis,cis-muconate cycloisomerase
MLIMTSAEDLFSGVFARGGAAAAVSGPAWVQAMLDFEAALARSCAGAGLVPARAAAAITAACDADRFDVAAIGREAAGPGTPASPLVDALRAQLPEDVAGYVHRGATSQDVIDTAAMLVARRALAPILGDAAAAAKSCAALADAHRETIMVGRTLLQQAVPITFGLKAAGWLAGIARARRELLRSSEQQLELQFGGAAGTLASLGDRALDIAAALGRELELSLPALPWHAERTRLAVVAGDLAELTGSLGKVARDVTLLAQNEVGELRPRAGGGSSAMPHKRNPVAAVAVLACAERTPGLAATICSSLVAEHERAAGAWHAEWEVWSELLRLTGSAAAWAAEMLDTLEVDPARMSANLDAAGDQVMTESVVAALAAEVGPTQARELVDRALATSVEAGVPFRDALEQTDGLGLSATALDAALAPRSYLGAAGAFVDRAISEYAEG